MMPTPDSPIEKHMIDGVPNWPAIDFEVTCARCGYNLRMLTAPRCTECGLEFEWPRVLRQATSESDFLFEHHWRNRPIRSFLATVWRSFRPVKFWRSVSIYDRVRAGPLVFMLVLSIVWFAIIFEGLSAGFYLTFDALSKHFPVNPLMQPPVVWSRPNGAPIEYRLMYLTRSYLDITRLPIRAMPQCLWSPGFVAIALATTLAMLCGLRQTLGRCQVRSVQVLRVVAYTAIPIATVSAIIEHAFFLVVILGRSWDPMVAMAQLVSGFAAGMLLIYCYLVPGLRDYLRLPRPRALAATTALVAVLMGLASFVVCMLP